MPGGCNRPRRGSGSGENATAPRQVHAAPSLNVPAELAGVTLEYGASRVLSEQLRQYPSGSAKIAARQFGQPSDQLIKIAQNQFLIIERCRPTVGQDIESQRGLTTCTFCRRSCALPTMRRICAA